MSIGRVNGVTRPTGLRGMTVILEGEAFGDSLDLSQARVFFEGANDLPVPGVIADTIRDWTNGFIVTQVPQEIGDISLIWIETPTGVSDSVEFRLIQSGFFSPSLINWTPTTPLPQPLQGLGAGFVPVEDGPAPANYVFAVAGADSLETPVSATYRARNPSPSSRSSPSPTRASSSGAGKVYSVCPARSTGFPYRLATASSVLLIRGMLETDEHTKLTRHSHGSWRNSRSPGYLPIASATRGSSPTSR